MKALCFGSLNIDYTYQVPHFVRKGETLAAGELKTFSGGKGLNQSVALARAGAETYHAGAVGEDGGFLLRQLESAGVDTRFVRVLPEERTGHAIIQNDAEGDNCILLFGGANRTISEEQIEETLRQFGAGDCLVLQNEISKVDVLIRRAHERGMTIVLNPSPMEPAVLGYPLELVDLFLLNEIEAAQVLGLPGTGKKSGEELAAAVGERFPQAAVVLTLGSEGSLYRKGETLLRQRPYPVKTVVDTTGAGDTFTGFFLAGTMRGLAPEQAMDLASRASAIAVTRPGASPSIPTLAEVEAAVFS